MAFYNSPDVPQLWLREDQAVSQVHQLYRVCSVRTLQKRREVKKQRRSGWMKIRKGGVEVRKMAVADPFLAADPRILVSSTRTPY